MIRTQSDAHSSDAPSPVVCVCVCVSGSHVTWLAFALTLQGTKHLDRFVYRVNIEEKRQNKAANITPMALITASNRPWANNDKPDMPTRSVNGDYKEKALKRWQITHHSKQGPYVGNLIAMTWYRQACDSSNLKICGENKPGVTSVWIHLHGLGELSFSRTKRAITKTRGVRQREVDASVEVSWRVLKTTAAPAVSTAECNLSFSDALDKESSVY